MPLVGFAQAVIDLSANPYAKSTDDQFELMLPTKMEYDKTVFTDHTIYTAKNKVKAQDGFSGKLVGIGVYFSKSVQEELFVHYSPE